MSQKALPYVMIIRNFFTLHKAPATAGQGLPTVKILKKGTEYWVTRQNLCYFVP